MTENPEAQPVNDPCTTHAPAAALFLAVAAAGPACAQVSLASLSDACLWAVTQGTDQRLVDLYGAERMVFNETDMAMTEVDGMVVVYASGDQGRACTAQGFYDVDEELGAMHRASAEAWWQDSVVPLGVEPLDLGTMAAGQVCVGEGDLLILEAVDTFNDSGPFIGTRAELRFGQCP